MLPDETYYDCPTARTAIGMVEAEDEYGCWKRPSPQPSQRPSPQPSPVRAREDSELARLSTYGAQELQKGRLKHNNMENIIDRDLLQRMIAEKMVKVEKPRKGRGSR